MRWLLLFMLGFSACVRSSPQAPVEQQAAEPLNVPEGCLELLAGPWVHDADQTWRYDAEDDGGTLVLRVTRLAKPDAGFTPRKFRKTPEPVLLDAPEAAQAFLSRDGGAVVPEPDAGVADAGPVYHPDIRVELTRSAGGFNGFTLAPLLHPSGRTCDGRFVTTVVSCADGGLLIESQPATALGESCQSPAKPREPSPLQHRLIRPDAG